MKAVYFIENDSHHRQNVKRLSFYICLLHLFLGDEWWWWKYVFLKNVEIRKRQSIGSLAVFLWCLVGGGGAHRFSVCWSRMMIVKQNMKHNEGVGEIVLNYFEKKSLEHWKYHLKLWLGYQHAYKNGSWLGFKFRVQWSFFAKESFYPKYQKFNDFLFLLIID